MHFLQLTLLVASSYLPVALSELKCSFDTTPFDEISVMRPVSVASLDLSAYAGRWFQMYASMIPNKTYEFSGQCITADYSFIRSTPHALYVRHTMTTDNSPSEFISARALALHRNSLVGQQGVFQLLMGGVDEHYTKAEASHDFDTCIGNYRVVALGPKDEEGKYAWAVVSTLFQSSLFIIARNVKDFRDMYADDVLSLVEAMGFTETINMPRETYQDDDCHYIPLLNVD